MEIGKVIPAKITEELSQSYIDYAMSVIVARALPDIRDGLKPVHRKILYAMHLMSLDPGKPFSKSAKIVGEVLGKYHPHGDTAVYETLVRLAQDFSMRYPLVQGQGNFGSVDGDPAAAMRYTEARLAKISPYMLFDIEKDTVNFVDNFDATLKEPDCLPALLPNLLLMGSEGIAVGMATKIPPHNLGEVVDGVIETIKKGKIVSEDIKKQDEQTDFVIKKINLVAAGEEKKLKKTEVTPQNTSFESDITIEDLVEIIPGPDFPTGGAIYNAKDMVDVYSTGRGRISIRGIADIEEDKKGKVKIVITEIPYQVNKATLVKNIADLVKNKKVTGISDLRDESDKDGMRVVIELKRDARPKSVLNNIYKHTRLQTTFPANFVSLIEGTPYTVNLKQILTEYIKHRQRVVVRRTIFELTQAKKRAHILEGLKIALDNLDEVIKTIRRSKTQEEAKNNLIKRFELTAVQSTAILDMQLRRLAALEREKIEKEYKELKKLIDSLIAILKDPQRVLKIITDELKNLKEKMADKRRTKIYKQNIGEFSEEDLIAKKEAIIMITKTGYIKRLSRDVYKSQRRGGKGIIGMTMKEEDEIEHLVPCTTHDDILFFTNKGKVYGTRAWEIPEASRQAKGQAVVNILDIDQDELVLSVISITNKKSNHFIMATKKGVVKKTKIREFENMRSTGLIAIKMKADDELVMVDKTSGKDHVFLFTQKGKGIRFPESNVRPMGRATTGMKGIRLNPGDKVISMVILPRNLKKPKDKRKKFFRDILTLSEKGIGKRTAAKLFPVQKRAGKGVKATVVNERTGNTASAKVVTEKVEQVLITSTHGQVIKLPLKNIPQMGRSTQGVIMMRFAKKTDLVAAMAVFEKDKIIKEEETK